ncbi:FAD-dependent oxidoreductase [Gluconobacter frateurii]|uniref:D-amino acid dehydrogenase small subunit n=1 Tax=Gluconobacter frateurii NRIC 0228 TaxID=1307946 RepID=A0ABQ0QFC8_9PROT|nr:FAD-dependent oxidoreductase [Gluconobacter frateurii]GBR16874.1 D-amino acid dehydrogenase small subunit [Gluconobacter frateurii NRIC 0228]GLP90687.1 D-amino acid dehydrogenase 2 [Gluconobacter frateurii]
MKQHIAVIGGGVIGLSTAYALIRAGHDVTLIEQNEDVGLGASYANGGQLSYRYVSPLADAGIPRQALGWMLKPGSPVSLHLRADPRQWRWMLSFLSACNRSTNRRNAKSLLQLGLEGQAEMAAWRADGLDGYFWRQAGKLVLYRQNKAFRKAVSAIQDPILEQALSPAECAKIEPAFAHLEPDLAGGIFSPEDEVADSYLFCKALKTSLLSHQKFRFLPGKAALVPETAKRCALMVDGTRFATDLVVLAAGLNARDIAAPLGIHLPLYGLKGYSLTLRPSPETLPSVSVTDYDNRIVYARLGDALRVAAMVDIGAEDRSLNPNRLASLRNLVRQTLPGVIAHNIPDAPWTGLRPATPTGVPMVGHSGCENLLLNVGHGALGFTLAAGSAARIVKMIGQAHGDGAQK